MDGLLVVDKPIGPTSHDVVARVRRALAERRVGHTGTLDPAASGVLPLVLGRATRLAKFFSNGDKHYDARVRLGAATDTYDAEGEAAGTIHGGPWPSRADIERALDEFRGTFLQQPPVYSAKKVDGRRSYAVARANARLNLEPRLDPRATDAPRDSEAPRAPGPVLVTTRTIELVGADGHDIALRIECSAGFYVRSLAHDLGKRLGVGAHLAALRRTRSAGFTLEHAMPLDEVERDRAVALGHLVPLAALLPELPAVVLTGEGEHYLAHGREIGPLHVVERREGTGASVRLMGASGELLGMAEPTGASGFLHPSLVLM
jgi:tRNA pseudouridine55 synthase